MNMSVEEARRIVDAETESVGRFLDYMENVGVQLMIHEAVAASFDSWKPPRDMMRTFRKALKDVRSSFDEQWWEATPSLLLLWCAAVDFLEGKEVEYILPPAVVPSDETLFAYLILFHESLGYVATEDDYSQPGNVGTE